MRLMIRILGPILGVALASMGCGSGSPTSPTPPVAAPAPAAPAPPAPTAAPPAQAQKAPSVKGTVSLKAKATSLSLRAFGAAAGIRVTLIGTRLSAMTDSRGHFTIKDAPVGKARLHFEGEGVHADLRIPDLHEGKELDIHVAVDGDHADADCAMETDEPEGDNNDDENSNQCGDQNGNEPLGQPRDFKGKIESINGSTLKVSGKTVHTDHNTKIEKGDKVISLSDLKVGETVEVEGTLQADGSILAKQINVEDDAEDDSVHH